MNPTENPVPPESPADPESDDSFVTWVERRAELAHYVGLTDWQVALCAGLPALVFFALLLRGGEGRSGFAMLSTYAPIPVLVLICQALSRRFGWGRFLGGVLVCAGVKMVLTASLYAIFILRHASP